jgi:hypothetical protein
MACLHVSHVLVEGRARMVTKETEVLMEVWSLYLTNLWPISWTSSQGFIP